MALTMALVMALVLATVLVMAWQWLWRWLWRSLWQWLGRSVFQCALAFNFALIINIRVWDWTFFGDRKTWWRPATFEYYFVRLRRKRYKTTEPEPCLLGYTVFLLKCRVAKLPHAEMKPKQRNLVNLQNHTPIRVHSFFTISPTLKAKCRRLVLNPGR